MPHPKEKDVEILISIVAAFVSTDNAMIAGDDARRAE